MKGRPVVCRVSGLVAIVLLAACGEDPSGTDPSTDAGSDGSGAGDASADADGADDGSDAGDSADAPDEGSSDTQPDTDVTDDADVEPCPGSISCIDDRTGNPSVAVCREAGFADGTTCARVSETLACCVAPFACATDEDCEAARAEEGFCADPRFPCVCLADGSCDTWVCSASSECADGEACVDGGCVPGADVSLFEAEILTPDGYLTPGGSLPIDAVAVDPDDRNVVNEAAAIVFEADGDATISEAGVVTAGATGGVITVTARVAANAGDEGDTATFRIVPAPADGFRTVQLVDEATRAPLVGATVAYESASTLVGLASDVDGLVALPDSAGDTFHVFAEGYSYVSVFDAVGETIVVSVPPTQRARIDEVRDGFVCDTSSPSVTLDDDGACGDAGQPPCLCYDLIGVDAVKGVPDFSRVQGGGEVDVSLSGFSLGNSLLDLNFDLIVGPQVNRIIPDNPVIPLDEPVDIPSGVTLYFNNSPFVDSYIATAPAGSRSVWSVGGTVPLGDTLLALLPSLGGDLDFGAIVASILPLFDEFYSGVTPAIDLESGGTFPVRSPALTLNVPTRRRVTIEPPGLPTVGSGWADTAIILGGALVPGQGFVPLGVSGGSDTVARGEADGVLDGDHDADGVQPLRMSMAPIHGAIAGPSTRYAVVSVALLLDTDRADAPREASSGIMTVLDRGEAIPDLLTFDQPTFPLLAEGTTWTTESRTVALPESAPAVDLYRLVFRGEEDRLWIVYGAPGRDAFTLPEPSALGFEDRTARGRLNVVGVTLRDSEGVDYDALLSADGGTLMDLFTFIDAFSILGL